MTPQQKKALSLKRDHRKSGENGKAIRKMSSTYKRCLTKAYRTSTHQAIRSAGQRYEEVDDLVRGVQRKSWQMNSDQPLGEILDYKRMERLWRVIQPASRQDSTYLDRLEKRLLAGPIHPTEVRMGMRQVRSAMMSPHSTQWNISQRMAAEIKKIIPRLRPKPG